MTKLDIDKENFRILCVLSGNDYYNNNNNIFHYLKLYNRYKKIKKENYTFMDWLLDINHLNKDELDEIENVSNIYKDVKNELANYPYTVIKFGGVDKESLYNILERDRFVF